MARTIDFIVDLGILGEQTVEVEYDYSPGRPGKMYMRNGDPGYPDEPPECDVVSVRLVGPVREPLQLLREALENHDPLFDAIGEHEAEQAVADMDQYVRELNEGL